MHFSLPAREGGGKGVVQIPWYTLLEVLPEMSFVHKRRDKFSPDSCSNRVMWRSNTESLCVDLLLSLFVFVSQNAGNLLHAQNLKPTVYDNVLQQQYARNAFKTSSYASGVHAPEYAALYAAVWFWQVVLPVTTFWHQQVYHRLVMSPEITSHSSNWTYDRLYFKTN